MTVSAWVRPAALAAVALAMQACASSSNVFERHEADMVRRATVEATTDRALCPVLAANATDVHLEVEYEAGGMKSGLGVLPAGQQLRFDVFCDTGRVRAVGVTTMGGLFDDATEYRTSARLDPVSVAVLHFTESAAIR